MIWSCLSPHCTDIMTVFTLKERCYMKTKAEMRLTQGYQ